MKAVIVFLKYHWQQRIFRISTGVGLCLLFMEIFHKPELNQFLTNQAFVLAVIAFLFHTDKI